MSELRISIHCTLRRGFPALSALRRAALHALKAERFRSGRLSIAVVGRCAMSRLHAAFTSARGPTDVLTFDLGSVHRRGIVDAEIVVCADVAEAHALRALRRGARRASIPAPAKLRIATLRELSLYVVHGVLHLAGYDDHSPAGFSRMHAREDQLLEELGIGPVFKTAAVERSSEAAPRSSRAVPRRAARVSAKA